MCIVIQTPSLQACLSHNTPECIAIQTLPLSALQAAAITIQNLYRDTAFCPAKPPLFQYNSSLLQYNFYPLKLFSCNTIPLKPAIFQPHQVTIQWLYRDPVLMSQRGSSPANFAPNLFFRFSPLFFFHFISSY